MATGGRWEPLKIYGGDKVNFEVDISTSNIIGGNQHNIGGYMSTPIIGGNQRHWRR